VIKEKFLSYNYIVKKLLFLTTILFISAISHAAVSGPPSGSPILNSTKYQKNSAMNIDTATIRTANISTFTTVPNFTYGIKINTTTYTTYGVLAGSRYLLYTLTSGMDCSGNLNGGKLTSTGSDIFCSDDSGTGGGGGGSALGVYQDSVQKSSPTTQINFISSSGLSVTVPAAGTATITLNGNSTNYIRNSNTLLAGSTAYVQYLYVVSTASISNLLSAGSMTVTNLSANKLVATDGNNKFWSKGAVSLSTEVAGVLDWPNLTPNATSYIRNSTAVQNDSKFIVNIATFTDGLYVSTTSSSLNLYTYKSVDGFYNSVISHKSQSISGGTLIIGQVDRALDSSYGIALSSNAQQQYVSYGRRSYLNDLGIGSGGEYYGSSAIYDDRNNHILMASTNATHGGSLGDWGPPFNSIVNIIKSTADVTKSILSIGYEQIDGFNYVLQDSYLFNTDKADFLAPLHMNNANDIKFYDLNNSNYVSFVSSDAISYNQSYVLPDSTGTLNDILSLGPVRADGKIETKWRTVLAGSGGGYYLEPATVTINANNGIYATCASTSNERFGYLSLNSCTGIASNNSSFGSNSLIAMTTGSFNSSFGSLALNSLKGGGLNNAFGYKALFTNVSGSRNVAVGNHALEAHKGSDSTAIGYQSLDSLTFGNGTAVGSGSLKSVTTSVGNSALGLNSLATATGSSNTAVGDSALGFYTTINANTAIGYSALYGAAGDNNTGVGFLTGEQIGSYPAISSCTFIGYQARQGANSLTNATAIGAGSVVSSSNAIVLGNTGIKVGIGLTVPLSELSIAGHVQIASNTTTTPVVSACGTSPSVSGYDGQGEITVGTGGIATSCTITFGKAWTTAPTCSVYNEGAILFVRPVTTTTTLVIDAATPLTASGKIKYMCIGRE